MSGELTALAMLFDLDGTLVDSSQVTRATWRDWSDRGLTISGLRNGHY